MYNNKTKDRILKAFIEWQFANPGKPDAQIEFENLFKGIKRVTLERFGRACVYLNYEGYLEFDKKELGDKDKTVWIGITQKGISAGMESYFLSKHYDVFYRRLIDLGLIICNLIIALVAIIALNRGNSNDFKRYTSPIIPARTTNNKAKTARHSCNEDHRIFARYQ